MYRHRNWKSDLFDIANTIFMIMLIIITVYPILFIVFASVSDPIKMQQGMNTILLKPMGFNMVAYEAVLKSKNIYIGYMNTIFYVVLGTAINIFVTSMLAYALSRKNLLLKNPLMFMIAFTMFFGGGLIPTFLWVNTLGLNDTRAILILINMVVTWNLIIMRNAFAQIPDAIEESGKIDGANDFVILFRLILPMSKAVLAVMVLYYAVMHWNGWFDAMIYIRNRTLYPLQLFLREILILSSLEEIGQQSGFEENQVMIKENIKYATIVISTVPILCIYPFLQKHFAKGVMVGSIKG